MERIIVQDDLERLYLSKEGLLKKTERARQQAATDVRADIQKMINNPVYSNVVFRCKDGTLVHASRLFLIARSVIFQHRLLNGTAESQASEITLPELSSTQLLPVMEFLYTGTLQEHRPTDWKNAYEMVGAAKIFLLDGLELIAVEYLLLAVERVQADVEAAAKLLSITVEFVGILGDIAELIARVLVCILESTSLKPKHLQALTSNAFQYFLRATKTKNAELKLPSSAEFLRMRNIIVWCACKEFAAGKVLALDGVSPEIESTLELLQRLPVQVEHCLLPEIFRKIRSTLAASVEEYLPFVNLRRIPARFLVHIVEPMEIISSYDILGALRFHALTAVKDTSESTRDWSTSFGNWDIYRVSRGGSVIQQIAMGNGFARYNLPLEKICGRIFEWEISIEKVCDDFIEIGLQQDLGSSFIPQYGCSLSGQPGGWALHMDSEGLSINRSSKRISRPHSGDSSFTPYGKDCSQLVYGQHYAHKNSKVKIRLDLYCGSCSFSVDHKDFLLAWTCIPNDEVYYPAVSLGTGSSGRVCISKIIRNGLGHGTTFL